MTARAEYTSEEWILLRVAPQAAIGAVVFSDGINLFEAVSEGVMAAVMQARGKERFPHNELIAALIDNKERVDPARLPQPPEVGESAGDALQRLRALAVEKCRAAMALLAERSNPAEAEGYAAWVMEMARTAATTVRHKVGLFGVKGPLVDAEERAVLTEIADALGVALGELPFEPAAGPGSAPAPDVMAVPRDGSAPDIPSGPIHPS